MAPRRSLHLSSYQHQPWLHSKPWLRRGKIETNITAVARGQRSKEDVLQEAAAWFKDAFLAAQQKAGEHTLLS